MIELAVGILLIMYGISALRQASSKPDMERLIINSERVYIFHCNPHYLSASKFDEDIIDCKINDLQTTRLPVAKPIKDFPVIEETRTRPRKKIVVRTGNTNCSSNTKTRNLKIQRR